MTADADAQSDAATSAVDASVVTFLMVGCQRCGSTWVDAALRDHPEIYLPAQKQSYFFDQHYDRGIDWYLDRFRDVTSAHRAVGEIATGYSLPHAVPMMAEHFPDAKLIMAMRHPIERAYSNFRTRRAEQGWSSFEDALEQSPDLLERGAYIDQIEHLLEHYPRDRMLFLLYDDLDRDDRAYLRRILEFLEVDPDIDSRQIGQRKNAAAYPRLRRVLHRAGLKPALRALSKSPVGDMIRRRNKKTGGVAAPSIDPATRTRLVDHFRPLNDRLGTFLDRDLAAWNQ